MDKISFLKKTVSTIVGIGTTKIIKGIIENNVDTSTKTSMVTVAAASAAIGYAIAEDTSDYTDRKIDEAVAFWLKHVTNRKTSD